MSALKKVVIVNLSVRCRGLYLQGPDIDAELIMLTRVGGKR